MTDLVDETYAESLRTEHPELVVYSEHRGTPDPANVFIAIRRADDSGLFIEQDQDSSGEDPVALIGKAHISIGTWESGTTGIVLYGSPEEITGWTLDSEQFEVDIDEIEIETLLNL